MRHLRKLFIKISAWIIPVVLIGSLLFWRESDTSFLTNWVFKGVLMCAGLLIFLGGVIWKRFSWLSSVVFIYFTLHCLYFSYTKILKDEVLLELLSFIHDAYPVSLAKMRQGLHEAALMNLLYLICVPVFCLFQTKKSHDIWSFVVNCAGLICALGIIFTAYPRNQYLVPFLHNPSLTATFLAVLIGGVSWPLVLIYGFAILYTHATTPLLTMGAALLIRYWRDLKLWQWVLFSALPLYYIFSLVVPKFSTGGNGRFDIWGYAYDWWKSQGPFVWWFGAGEGSTPVIVPLIQMGKHYDPNSFSFYMYMHNDWLQFLFEGGAIGLSLAVLLYGEILLKSKNKAMVAAFGVAMVSNFPLHSPLITLFGILLMGRAYLGRDTYAGV